MRWPGGQVQYLENVPADQKIVVTQTPSLYVDSPRVAASAPAPLVHAEPVSAPEAPRLPPEELAKLLDRMEERLRADPANHSLAYAYRRRCVEHEEFDRPIRFFTGLVEQSGGSLWTRIELSVAHVDKMPSRGGIAAIVSKGILARRSLEQLNILLAGDEDLWVAHYARGMNHLHWPRALRHADDAVADFRRCLELQGAEPADTAPSYYVRTYVLLGEALGKMGSFEEARQTWRDGLARYPDSRELAERVALVGDKQILAFIEARRSLESPIDTDFSFLDEPRFDEPPLRCNLRLPGSYVKLDNKIHHSGSDSLSQGR